MGFVDSSRHEGRSRKQRRVAFSSSDRSILPCRPIQIFCSPASKPNPGTVDGGLWRSSGKPSAVSGKISSAHSLHCLASWGLGPRSADNVWQCRRRNRMQQRLFSVLSATRTRSMSSSMLESWRDGWRASRPLVPDSERVIGSPIPPEKRSKSLPGIGMPEAILCRYTPESARAEAEVVIAAGAAPR